MGRDRRAAASQAVQLAMLAVLTAVMVSSIVSTERDASSLEPDAAAADPRGDFAAGDDDVAAAVAANTREDDGSAVGPVRWERDAVAVAVGGPDADADALAQVDRALAWISDASGVTFHRVAGPTDRPGWDAPPSRGDATVWLAEGAAPAARTARDGAGVAWAHATWDPTDWWSQRWAYEELIHLAGPPGDQGPPDAVLSTSQRSSVPGAWDAWLLRGLYGPDELPTDPAELAAVYRDQD